jgi:hypothetical protein
MSLPLLVSSTWALLLLFLSLGLPRLIRGWEPQGQARPARRAWVSLAALALIARLVPNFLLPVGAGYDIDSYQIVAGLVLEGRDVYASPEAENRHPYLPFQMYWSAAAQRFSQAVGLSFVKVFRLGPIFADVLIALLLYAVLLRSSTPRRAFYGGLSYALNPIPILVSAYHGQFDALPALFILLALYCQAKTAVGAGASLGLGILSKSWPVLAVPALLAGVRRWPRRLLLVGMAVIVPLIGLLVYLWVFHADLAGVLSQALGYNRGVGAWGYTYLLRLLAIVWPGTGWLFQGAMLHWGRFLTLACLGLFWWVRVRKETPQAGVLTTLVAFLAVTHAFSIQYLMWVIPFAILEQDDRWLARYTLSAFAYMFLVYNTLILESSITRLLPLPQADWFIIMPSGLPAWLVTVAWAWDRWRGSAQIERFQSHRA